MGLGGGAWRRGDLLCSATLGAGTAVAQSARSSSHPGGAAAGTARALSELKKAALREGSPLYSGSCSPGKFRKCTCASQRGTHGWTCVCVQKRNGAAWAGLGGRPPAGVTQTGYREQSALRRGAWPRPLRTVKLQGLSPSRASRSYSAPVGTLLLAGRKEAWACASASQSLLCCSCPALPPQVSQRPGASDPGRTHHLRGSPSYSNQGVSSPGGSRLEKKGSSSGTRPCR